MDASHLVTEDLVKTCLMNDKGEKAKFVEFLKIPSDRAATFNQISKIQVNYIEDGQKMQTSYIAKLNPCRTDDPFNPYRNRAVEKEVFFYTEFLPLLNEELSKVDECGLKVPKYLGSLTEEGKEVIIFEDLKLAGYKVLEDRTAMDVDHITLMAKELARLHTSGLLLKKKYHPRRLTEVFPILLETLFVEGQPQLRNSFSKLYLKGVNKNIDILAALQTHEHLLSLLKNLTTGEKCLELIVNHLQGPPEWDIICHGDFHQWNVFFKYDENKKPSDVIVFDWQTIRVTQVGSDVRFAPIFCPRANRELLIHEFEKTHYETISKLLGKDAPFSLENLKKHTENNHFALLAAFYLMPMSTCLLEPSKMFDLQDGAEERHVADKNDGHELLKNNDFLKELITDYSDEIIEKEIHLLF